MAPSTGKETHMKKIVFLGFFALFAFCSHSQTNVNLTCLLVFNGTNGEMPLSGLTLARDGNFYGTTFGGGQNQTFNGYTEGTAFKMTSSGDFTTFFNFGNDGGYLPSGHLVQADDGNFYGTTTQGGNLGDGTVFRLSPQGQVMTLCSFGAYNQQGGDSTNGWSPDGLCLGTDGNFYGVTDNYGFVGGATIFRITPQGTLSTLKVFVGRNTLHPSPSLLAAKDGNLYGIIGGHLFWISSKGEFSTNVICNGSKVSISVTSLIRGRNGLFFGVICSDTNGSSVLRIDDVGRFNLLTKFGGNNEKFECPSGEFIEASDGAFYGYLSGASLGNCSIVRLKSDGTITKIFSLGWSPSGSLVEGKNGKIYGTTAPILRLNQGTIFCFTP